LQYCDGASFAGTVAQPVLVNGTPLYFRGRAVLDATIDAMLADGLAAAKEVILKGCSAVRASLYKSTLVALADVTPGWSGRPSAPGLLRVARQES
jgi:hypothetical protein